jgi:hypothetical protein
MTDRWLSELRLGTPWSVKSGPAMLHARAVGPTKAWPGNAEWAESFAVPGISLDHAPEHGAMLLPGA